MEGKAASRSSLKLPPFSLSEDDEDDQSNKPPPPVYDFDSSPPKVKEVKPVHLRQSIPSMVDGLKPVQRKILFCAFESNLVTEITVGELSGDVLYSAAYHDGGLQSVVATIVGMAQDFVGSNNINLFNPGGGQIGFGSRYSGGGGKVDPKARHLYTNLTPIARFLFPKDDDIILNYLNYNGRRIEPTWYAPVIPLVLVNGLTKGTGKGWSTFVPSYNPRDLCANVRRLLRGEPMVPMDPWYKGFRGPIEKTTIKESGASYTVSGIIEEIDETTLRITELPVRRWTEDYQKFLYSVTGIDKINERFTKDVHFEIIMSKENLRMAKEEGLMKKFKLTTTISTNNMHLFDPKGVIKKYDSPEQILEEFFHLRLQLYGKRKEMLLPYLQLELVKLECTDKFIRDFTTFKKTKSTDEENSSQANVDLEENDEQFSRFYEDLLSSLNIRSLQELRSQQEKLTSKVDELRKSTPHTLWIKDLDALEQKLYALGQ